MPGRRPVQPPLRTEEVEPEVMSEAAARHKYTGSKLEELIFSTDEREFNTAQIRSGEVKRTDTL